MKKYSHSSLSALRLLPDESADHGNSSDLEPQAFGAQALVLLRWNWYSNENNNGRIVLSN